MRIGELAALVGVTPRAVRHYHHLGLLPEPLRLSNGYRDFGMREAVLLARIRRLTELGLGLDEVRDVLADDQGRELAEVLQELDEDLERQESALREQRVRLAPLLAEALAGRLDSDGPVSPEFATLLQGLGEVTRSPIAAQDREHLALLDALVPESDRRRLMAALHGMKQHADEAYGLLDALADAEPDDPQVASTAAALADFFPDDLAAHFPDKSAGTLADGIFADLAPAQSAAIARAMELVTEKQKGPS
ncbi:MerR family transcriptional regulator [Streptomyces sp. NPDC058576]|uniref:MerR family transcriptional regulator n=1 Tax=Streptomyces sp. NPDC058576 TaxID=3346547 RepID=UPI00364F6DDA